MRFSVVCFGSDPLGLCETLERFANEQWLPAHVTRFCPLTKYSGLIDSSVRTTYATDCPRKSINQGNRMPIAKRIPTADEEAQTKNRREFEQSAQYKHMLKRQEGQQKAYEDREDKATARAAKPMKSKSKATKPKKAMKWIGSTYRRPT